MKASIHAWEEATGRRRRRMPRIIEQVKLFCTKGNSDKEYELILEEEEDGLFVVRANYGRRGSVLRPVEKHRSFNSWLAKEEYDNTYNEKLDKGYTDKVKKPARKTVVDKPKTPPPPKVERVITLGEL